MEAEPSGPAPPSPPPPPAAGPAGSAEGAPPSLPATPSQYSTPQLSRIFVLGRFSQAPGHDFLLLLFLNKKIKRMQLEIYWIVVFMVIIRMHLLKVEVSVWCSLSRIL